MIITKKIILIRTPAIVRPEELKEVRQRIIKEISENGITIIDGKWNIEVLDIGFEEVVDIGRAVIFKEKE